MGILDKLKNKMRESTIQNKIDESMPSDEELQQSQKGRRETASRAAEYLGEKGYPTLGGIAGAAVDMTADLMPGRREEFKENIAGGTMGTTGSRIGKLAGRMPPGKISPLKPDAEALGKRWAGLSGEERAALGNNRSKYIADQLKKEEIIAAEADNARKALKEEVRSNPSEGPELSDMYRQVDTSKRKMMDPSKVFEGPRNVANVESGKALPKASELVKEEPQVIIPKFRQYEGPTHREQLKAKEAAKLEAEIRKRMSKK